MPLYLNHCTPGITFMIWKIEESESQLLALFDQPEKIFESIKDYTAYSRRLERLAVRMLLQEQQIDPALLDYYPNGQPFLRDHSYFFSCSHTRQYAAIALHRTFPIGIDIERQSPRIHTIAHKFMHPIEMEQIDKKDTQTSLLIHWSAKESLFKVLGKSEIDFKEHLRIAPFTLKTNGHFAGYEYKTIRQQTYQLFYRCEEDFVLTYALPSFYKK